MIQIAS
jgi:hypothetical protein